MTKDEALKLALEALTYKKWFRIGMVEQNDPRVEAAITAIKEALAQPAQEPDELTIAYMSGLYDGKKKRPWVGLTFAEICECENDSLLKFARAIEAALRSKNHD